MVSPWMKNGNLATYPEKHDLQITALLKLVSICVDYDNIIADLPQLCDVAAGLKYRELLSFVRLRKVKLT